MFYGATALTENLMCASLFNHEFEPTKQYIRNMTAALCIILFLTHCLYWMDRRCCWTLQNAGKPKTQASDAFNVCYVYAHLKHSYIHIVDQINTPNVEVLTLACVCVLSVYIECCYFICASLQQTACATTDIVIKYLCSCK